MDQRGSHGDSLLVGLTRRTCEGEFFVERLDFILGPPHAPSRSDINSSVFVCV